MRLRSAHLRNPPRVAFDSAHFDATKKNVMTIFVNIFSRAFGGGHFFDSNIVGNIFCKQNKKNNQNADTCRGDIQKKKTRKTAPVWRNHEIFENAAPRIQKQIMVPAYSFLLFFTEKYVTL